MLGRQESLSSRQGYTRMIGTRCLLVPHWPSSRPGPGTIRSSPGSRLWLHVAPYRACSSLVLLCVLTQAMEGRECRCVCLLLCRGVAMCIACNKPVPSLAGSRVLGLKTLHTTPAPSKGDVIACQRRKVGENGESQATSNSSKKFNSLVPPKLGAPLLTLPALVSYSRANPDIKADFHISFPFSLQSPG